MADRRMQSSYSQRHIQGVEIRNFMPIVVCLWLSVFSLSQAASAGVGVSNSDGSSGGDGSVPLMASTRSRAAYDNSWCFRGVFDYDNCPEKGSLHECVRCCADLQTYYDSPPSKNVCLATCADRYPKLRIEWKWH